MNHRLPLKAALLAGCVLFSPAVSAQQLSAEDVAALRAEIAALRAKVDALEAQVGKAGSTATSALATAEAAKSAAPVVKWKGAPEISDGKGWSFKPRGRVQWDVATVNTPGGVTNPGLGFSNKLRRVYLGFQGTMPGGFGYRAEVDLANSTVTATDMYITYDDGPLNVTLGQYKPFGSLDELTSDLDTSLVERAAFVQAFGLERRLGASIGYAKGDFLLNAGVFTDNIADLSASGSDANNSYSIDGRAVFMPKLGDVQLHAGASVHWRDLNNLANGNSRYRARPGTRTTDVRFIDSGNLPVSSEFAAGLELAALSGPFYATGEGYWFRPERADTGRTVRLFGGYSEIGYVLGGVRPYKKGVFANIVPTDPVGEGGMGALQFVLRFDYLDLQDAARGVNGGTQKGYIAGVNWIPIDHIKFMLNYGRYDYSNVPAALADGTDRSYGVDTVVARAQMDF